MLLKTVILRNNAQKSSKKIVKAIDKHKSKCYNNEASL